MEVIRHGVDTPAIVGQYRWPSNSLFHLCVQLGASIFSLFVNACVGQERFGNMTRVYYKEAVGCILVFDVTRPASFEAVQKWKQDLDTKVQLPSGARIPCVLLGNKVCKVLLLICEVLLGRIYKCM